MINKIKKIKQAKIDIKDSKESLLNYFKDTYPTIFNKDINEIEDDINKHLEILLTSSLKYKTTRIRLDRPNSRYDSVVILARNKCLHYLNRNYGIKLFKSEKQEMLLNKNGDFINKDDGYNNRKKGNINIRFSVLKNNKLINQKQLNKVISLRWKAIKIQKSKKESFFSGRNYSFDEENSDKINSKISLLFSSKGMTFNSECERYGTGSIGNFEDFTDASLEILIKSWDKVIDLFVRKEKEKKRFVKKYKRILKELKDANRAYLVLQKLIK